MSKTILITGSTDGIGLETAKMLLGQGHTVLLHGRNADKLKKVESKLSQLGNVEGYIADLSDLDAVKSFAKNITNKHAKLDVIINNAGVLRVPNPNTKSGIDVRFVVNTIAPYLLTKEHLPLLSSEGRVINLSSAAQAPVDLKALTGKRTGLDAMDAYSQSKLAITMWSFHMAQELGNDGPTIIAVNPGSLLASKMVKEGFGVAGNDLSIGAEILTRLALDDEFSDASGKYFDNDRGQFGSPNSDALDESKRAQVVNAIEAVLTEKS